MYKEIVWLVSFGLTILAIVIVTKTMVPHTKPEGFIDEPKAVEKAA